MSKQQPPEPSRARTGPWPTRRGSLRSYLLLLALAPLTLLVIVTAASIWVQYRQQSAMLVDGLRETAHAIALAVDRELDTGRAILETLAASELIDAADWRAFYELCVKIMKSRQDGAIILMDRAGQMLLNTAVEFGTPLPRLSHELADQTIEWEGRRLPLSNSRMLFDSLASGQVEYSDLYYGRVGKRPAVAIAVPVMRGGTAPYMMAISSTPKVFAALLQHESNSADLDMLIVDRAGRIISRDNDPEKVVGHLTPEPLHRAIATARSGIGETVLFDDGPSLYAFSRSAVSNWSVVVAAPRDRVLASIRRSLAPWLVAVFVVITAGIMFAQSIWRRVATPLGLLTQGAEAIQRGQQPEIPVSGIDEVDTLSRMLRHASLTEHARREEVLKRQLAEEREKATADTAEELRRSEQRYRSLFDNNLDPIFSLNGDGLFVSANAAAERLFGYTTDELKSKDFAALCIPEKREDAAAAVHDILARRSRDFETVISRDDDARVDLFVTGAPMIVDDQVTGVSCIGRDITERNRLTAELQQRVGELREADRRKDEFLAVLAHELRNPLAPIRNAVEYLRLKGPQDSETEWCRNVIDQQARQMARLMDDLLDVSRITSNKLELRKARVTLEEVLRDAIETSRPLFDGRIELAVDLSDDPLWLDADTTRLAQVFSNLLNNAAKYTDSGGHIRIHGRREGAQAVVTVRDTGIGISPELLPKIFDMFVQGDDSHRAQGGLGLGLTLARDIVRIHGGTIEAASAGHGRGSEFIVRLPLADRYRPDTTLPPAFMQTDSTPEPQPKRVLVVEDNKSQAQSLARLLQLMGHEVRVTANGASALETLADFAADVALIDIGLPGMSGYEVARRIRDRSEFRKTKLVAQTGWGREEDVQRAREAGFDHHLVKPIDHRRLQDILRSAQ